VEPAATTIQATQHPTFAEAFRFWLKLGFISFGGPTGQIAIMHAELVEKKRWISEARFLHAPNYCMLLPGPEAQQLATYVGWLLHKTCGGVVAGALFVIPSMFILWALSFVYVTFGAVPWVAAIFYGLKPAVLAIVAAAVIRIGSKALKNEVMWSHAALAFVAIYFLKVPFPIIILSAAAIGLIGGKVRRDKFLVFGGHGPKAGAEEATVIDDNAASAEHTRPTLARALKVCATWLALWWIPVALLALWLGTSHTLFREAIFFSKASMVTFGGAYVVLPYVSQQASRRTTGSPRRRCWTVSASPKRHPARSSWCCNSSAFSAAGISPAHSRRSSARRSARSSRRGRPSCRASSGSSSARRTSRSSAATKSSPPRFPPSPPQSSASS